MHRFKKKLSGMPSMYQTVWILIRPDNLSGLIWVQTACKSYLQTTKELNMAINEILSEYPATILFELLPASNPFAVSPVKTAKPLATQSANKVKVKSYIGSEIFYLNLSLATNYVNSLSARVVCCSLILDLVGQNVGLRQDFGVCCM